MHSYDDNKIIPGLRKQLVSSDTFAATKAYFSAPVIDLDSYDSIILCMSGGKDSIACLLHLIDLGVNLARVELWHHDVDGREGSTLMDWPFMSDYNIKLAQVFGVPLYFSWLEGGFEGEMLKDNGYSLPHHIQTPEGLLVLPRDTMRAKPGTRLKFPQLSDNLQTRWCSSALKIDVGRRALNNQSRFDGQRVLFITGERRVESTNRARYNQLEPHACDRRSGRKGRWVDAWRPVLDWSEERVWNTLQRYGVLAPVPYRLGWGRSSCMKCIFSNAVLWATLRHYFPGSIDDIMAYEEQFDTTINRKHIPVRELSVKAKPLDIDDSDAGVAPTKTDTAN
ncbi:phosphohydrolase [Pectobacterium carotovorum]|uniref:phosphohydrolase n=1 Tax=Pectobacterium carotovorum TaxID=554 RepID=UPI0032EE9DCF